MQLDGTSNGLELSFLTRITLLRHHKCLRGKDTTCGGDSIVTLNRGLGGNVADCDWALGAYGFVHGIHQPHRHQTIESRHQRLGSVNNCVKERAVFLHVTPFFFARQLLHRLFGKVTFEGCAVSETLHLSRHERRMMCENLDALEWK